MTPKKDEASHCFRCHFTCCKQVPLFYSCSSSMPFTPDGSKPEKFKVESWPYNPVTKFYLIISCRPNWWRFPDSSIFVPAWKKVKLHFLSEQLLEVTHGHQVMMRGEKRLFCLGKVKGYRGPVVIPPIKCLSSLCPVDFPLQTGREKAFLCHLSRVSFPSKERIWKYKACHQGWMYI